MKNTVALYNIILNVFEPKPFNDKDITDLSVLEFYGASNKHLIQIPKDDIGPMYIN